MPNEPRLDPTDARIVLALAADPRSSAIAIADRLGLSRNTVQARLARLESSGVLLSYEHRVDPAALGYPLTAFLFVPSTQVSEYLWKPARAFSDLENAKVELRQLHPSAAKCFGEARAGIDGFHGISRRGRIATFVAAEHLE